jgi:hypothetical protein
MANDFEPGKLIKALRALDLNASGRSDDFLVGAPKDVISYQLYELERVCHSADLRLSLISAGRIRGLLTGPQPMKYGEVKPLLHDFFHRISDEIESARFFAVPERVLLDFKEADGFGFEVARAFPSAKTDVQESISCYLLGRHTASVFHLMRVLEIALKSFGDWLGVPLSKSQTWGEIINTIEKSRGPGKRTDQLSEIVFHLTNVKNAWRNPTMHVERTYDEELARDLLRETRRFTVQLATLLLKASPQSTP